MKKDSEAFLADLLNAPSPSGFEQPASAIFRKRLKGCVDELNGDVHGNTFAVLNPKAPFKFMLAGHIDEIGLMVTQIDEQGFLYVAQIGGMDVNLLVGQRMTIQTAHGPVLGVVGRQAIHLMEPEDRTKGVRMEGIWIDIGAKDKKEAEKVVSIGDPMVIDVRCEKLRGDRWVSRGCDDKVGTYVVAETMRELSGKKLNICVVGVATVQEEIGLRGATTSSYSVHPNAGIALDVTFASDYPEGKPKVTGVVKMGQGPVLHRGPNINPILGKELIETAKKHKVPYQVTGQPRGTGTDANAMQLSRGGVAAALLSIPNRYMHTPVEMVSTSDLDNAVKLLVTYLSNFPKEKDFRP